jgi:vanillate/3-O-methylgallate O-demethylase
MAKFDHDFIGRETLAAEIAEPKRTTVTLRWNPGDVMNTFA